MTITITDLYVYPLKSAAGIRLEAADLHAFGLAGDRRWMLVDETNRFLTQRELSRMSLIQPLKWTDDLTLRAPGAGDLHVHIPEDDAPPVDVVVWDARCRGRDAGDEAARWASAFLERPCRLVYAPATLVRPVDPTFDEARDTPDAARTAFSDGFPLLLIGQSSLDRLNERLTERDESPVPMNRFRPNVVVNGAAPHAEDEWTQLVVEASGERGEGEIRLDVVKPCARCSIVPVDQATGVRGKEPLRTLATYRARNGKVYFGQNVIHRNLGTLRIGDRVRVDQRVLVDSRQS